MTKLEQLLGDYRRSAIMEHQFGGHYHSEQELADAEEALKQHIEGAMEAAVVHGKETERERPAMSIKSCLDWQEARADAWDALLLEWAE